MQFIILFDEVKYVFKSFKDGKSSDTDKAFLERLKYNTSNNLLSSLFLLLNIILLQVSVPSTWLHSVIVSLYKRY